MYQNLDGCKSPAEIVIINGLNCRIFGWNLTSVLERKDSGDLNSYTALQTIANTEPKNKRKREKLAVEGKNSEFS